MTLLEKIGVIYVFGGWIFALLTYCGDLSWGRVVLWTLAWPILLPIWLGVMVWREFGEW